MAGTSFDDLTQVAFLYDHNVLQKEEDRIEDAIIFFHPASMSAYERDTLCGQLVGVTEWMRATLDQEPKLINLKHNAFAVKRQENYSLFLGLSSTHTTQHLPTLIRIINLYFKNITELPKNPDLDLRLILQKCLFYVRNYSDQLSSSFAAVPHAKCSQELHRSCIYVIQRCEEKLASVGGMITFKSILLYSQLPSTLTFDLMLLRNNFPCLTLPSPLAGCHVARVFIDGCYGDRKLGNYGNYAVSMDHQHISLTLLLSNPLTTDQGAFLKHELFPQLELIHKDMIKDDEEFMIGHKGPLKYNYTQFDQRTRNLKGRVAMGLSGSKDQHLFCDNVTELHERMASEPEVQEITLRNCDSIIYAHSNAGLETYCQKLVPKNLLWAPSERDKTFDIEQKVRDKLGREESKEASPVL